MKHDTRTTTTVAHTLKVTKADIVAWLNKREGAPTRVGAVAISTIVPDEEGRGHTVYMDTDFEDLTVTWTDEVGPE